MINFDDREKFLNLVEESVEFYRQGEVLEALAGSYRLFLWHSKN